MQPYLVAVVRQIACRLGVDEAVVAQIREEIAGGRSVSRVAAAIARSPEGIARALYAAAPTAAPYRSVDDIVKAVGLDRVESAFAASATHSLFDPTPGPGGMSPLAFARRCAEVAEVSVTVAEIAGARSDAPAVWLAGVMHDIGAAVLIAEAEGGAPRIPALADVPLDRHPLVGACLAGGWGLHPEIVSAIRCHEDPRIPSGTVARAVWLGARIVEARAGIISGERLAAAGAQFEMSPRILAQIATGGPVEIASEAPSDLTPREAQVFDLLADGRTPKQIALDLKVSVSTVHNHLHGVYRKLDVTSQARALIAARDRGWI